MTKDQTTPQPMLQSDTTSPATLSPLEQKILAQQDSIEAWFQEKHQTGNTPLPPPFYSSVDLRNAIFKLAPIDTNLFPAGFNNLSEAMTPLCIQAAQETIEALCPNIKRLLIIPESHRRNRFYFEHLFRLQTLLTASGYDVRIGSLDPARHAPETITLTPERTITLEPLVRKENQVGVADFFPCCILLNNDLSDGVPEILQNLSQHMLPPPALGWTTRHKSDHFTFYTHVADDFAKTFELDPWQIDTYFDVASDVDFMQKSGMAHLKEKADTLLEKIQHKYNEYGIDRTPFLAIKSDQGTYGMAVMTIKNSDELLALNRKQRSRMSSQKGGNDVSRVMLQEGVYTLETISQAAAEPVVYMIGQHPVGGFYRVHDARGPDENLNAPGMNFHPISFEESCEKSYQHPSDCYNRFYVYGVIARLAALAASHELSTLPATNKGIKK